MFMRGAAMALGAPILGAAFVAGAATGLGLGLVAVGGACLALKALKRRAEWREGTSEGGTDLTPDLASGPLPGDDEPHPGANPI